MDPPDWLSAPAPPPWANQVPDPVDDRDRPTPVRDEIVRQLAADEITGFNRDPSFLDKLKLADRMGLSPQEVAEALGIDPRAAPPLLGTGYTVTVANPTPPTNISYVACGTPPTFTMTANPSGRGAPTYTDDANLFAGAGTPAALTVISSPIGGGSGPTSEATGTVVVVTAPGSVAAAPTQSISVQGSYTTTPNASHPSMLAPGTPPTITGLLPVAPVSTGGSSSLTVNGTGFRGDSVVYIAGVPYNTQFNSATQLMVLNAPKRTSAGNTAITVVTGGTATAATNWVFS
jgi:hypothetical protein